MHDHSRTVTPYIHTKVVEQNTPEQKVKRGAYHTGTGTDYMIAFESSLAQAQEHLALTSIHVAGMCFRELHVKST